MDDRQCAHAKQVAPELYECPDGKLRWVYEMSLWKNPTLFFTLLKVFMGIVLGVAVLMFFIRLGDGLAEAGLFILQFLGIATSKPTTVGASLLAAAKSSSYSSFKSVKKIIAKRRRDTMLARPAGHACL